MGTNTQRLSLLLWQVLQFTTIMIHSSGAAEQTLHIGAFYPLTKSFSAWGAGCLPAAELAVEHLNNRSDILEGYRLELINFDSQGSPGVGTRELFNMLQEDPVKLMILGPFPSHIAISVAQTARWWNLLQVSPAAFTPELSERSLYPHFYRTRAALTSYNKARIAFLKHFQWKRVAIIARGMNYFIKTVDILHSDLEKADLEPLTVEVFQSENKPIEEMKRIQTMVGRIVIVFAYEEYARRIFCEAYKRSMYGEAYVWLLHYGNDPMWMTRNMTDTDADYDSCTSEEISRAAEGHFVTRDITLREDGVMPLAGQRPSDFMKEYLLMASHHNITPSEFYAPLTYDAMWSIAMTLNASVEQLLNQSLPNLEDFTYDNTAMKDVFVKSMDELHFEGMMGKVTFSETGDVGALQTKIQQYRQGAYHDVAQHDGLTDRMAWLSNPVWKNGNVPYDNVQTLYNTIEISRSVFYSMSLLAVCGMVYALFLLWFNITRRHNKLIRLSSPNMNNILLMGSLCAYVAVVLYGLSTQDLSQDQLIVVSHVKVVLLSVGYSLGFGSLFAKTWRVFQIFTSKTAKKLVISDRRLFGIVGMFLLMDLFFFILWFTLDPLHIVTTIGEEKSDSADPIFVTRTVVHRCTSKHSQLWQLILYAMKGIFLLFGVFLAHQTRKLKIAALNDSKYIGFSVYTVTTLCILGVPASFLLSNTQPDSRYVITSACILISTTVTLSILFIPKINSKSVGRVSTMPETTTTTRNGSKVDTENTNSRNICDNCKRRLSSNIVEEPSTIMKDNC